MYICPYCSVHKKSWKEVQTHTNRCNLSDHTYSIHADKGLLHYSDLLNNSLYDLQRKYSVTFIKSSIRKFKKYKLLDNDFSFKKSYTKEEVINLLSKLYLLLGKTPSVTDYSNAYDYPTATAVIKKFGTWNYALHASNIPINKIGTIKKNKVKVEKTTDRKLYDITDVNNALLEANTRSSSYLSKELFDTYKDLVSSTVVMTYYKTWEEALIANDIKIFSTNIYGISTISMDGHTYRSKVEAHFADTFLHNKYEYIIEPKYPNSNWLYDWYVVDLDLYIELSGGINPSRIADKVIINKQLNRRLLVVNYADAYKFNSIEELKGITMFDKVKEAIQNAIDNGYEPLSMKAQELAADLAEKASDFADDQLDDITAAVKKVKAHFGASDDE